MTSFEKTIQQLMKNTKSCTKRCCNKKGKNVVCVKPSKRKGKLLMLEIREVKVKKCK
jgi:hypothetical protein